MISCNNALAFVNFAAIIILSCAYFYHVGMAGIIVASPSHIEGTGDHYVIFCHGLGGSSDDFRNLKKGFNLEKHTLIFLGSVSGYKTLQYDINDAASMMFSEFIDLTKQSPKSIRLSEMKTLSMIGHSLGGLYAKALIYKMKEFDVVNDTALENFITIATPHNGVVGFSDYNMYHPLKSVYDRFKKQFLMNFMRGVGPDLVNVSSIPVILSKDIIDAFKNRINYVGVHFDASIPFWSGSMRLNETDLDFENIKEYETELHEKTWKTFTVPLTPYHPLNHANIIGKHLDGIFTFNKNRIRTILNHINKWFG